MSALPAKFLVLSFLGVQCGYDRMPAGLWRNLGPALRPKTESQLHAGRLLVSYLTLALGARLQPPTACVPQKWTCKYVQMQLLVFFVRCFRIVRCFLADCLIFRPWVQIFVILEV